jgi:hypothetical protein
MTDIGFPGLLSFVCFAGLILLSFFISLVSLISSYVAGLRNGSNMLNQRPLGFVIGSFFPFLTGIAGLIFVSHSPLILKASSDKFAPLFCLFALTVNTVVGLRWKR